MISKLTVKVILGTTREGRRERARAQPLLPRRAYCDGELERSAGGKFEEFVCKVVEA